MKKIVKNNCLAIKIPKLAKEWHSVKNGDLTPYDITVRSKKKVWWKCKNGHEYQESLSNMSRRKGKQYCLFCNSVAFLNPSFLKEWDYKKNKNISPQEVSIFSRKMVWWKCKNGHGWQDRLCKRSMGWGNCRTCNSLSFKFPKLASEWHPTKNGKLMPHEINYGSQKEVWWKCKNGHEWRVAIGARTSHNTQCPYCAHQRVYREISLAFLKPQLAKQWHPTKNNKLTPWDITAGSTKEVWWKCQKCKSEWSQTVNRRFHHKKCPYCDGKRINDTNSLASLRPDLLKEWDYKKNKLSPHQYHFKSSAKVWWKCKICGNEWWAAISEKAIGHQKCARCRSLGAKYPDLLKQLHPTRNKKFNPFNIFPGVKKKIWWICKKGHEYFMSINNKTGQKQGCPYCSNKKINDNNCFAALRPDLLKEWNYKKNKLSPRRVSLNSGKRVWWKCKKGHGWVAAITTRNYGHGCPKCRGIVLKDGTHCRSYVEALFYLKLKDKKINFLHDKRYGSLLGKFRYDFYIPSKNEYIEVTSFNKNFHYKHGQYFNYLRKIVKKKRHVINVMNAKFKFIQYIPNKKDMAYIKSNIQP